MLFRAACILAPCLALDLRVPPQWVQEDRALEASLEDALAAQDEAAKFPKEVALLSEDAGLAAPAAAPGTAASPALAPAPMASPAAAAPAVSGGFAFGEPVELVSEASCLKLSKATGALSCRIVSEISGEPEGCECRLMGSTCPPASRALGFTGVSPSQAIPVLKTAGQFVTLCMYWQWFDEPDRSKLVAEDKEETKLLANQYLQQGYDSVAEAVKPVVDMLASTTTFLGPQVSIDQVKNVVRERLFSTTPPMASAPAASVSEVLSAVGKGLTDAAGKGLDAASNAVAGLGDPAGAASNLLR